MSAKRLLSPPLMLGGLGALGGSMMEAQPKVVAYVPPIGAERQVVRIASEIGPGAVLRRFFDTTL
jgi:hypothetical protein